jgi:asparagine synthase (glutamine-hydrolysing)
MLEGVERLIDLTDHCEADKGRLEIETLAKAEDHFAVVSREGKTVRLARTIGSPLRYFVAKMHHGPMMIVADRIDRIFEWCEEQGIGWQFDPAYTRMVPAHYLVEVDQVGCPDPTPRYHRFFNPPIGTGSGETEEAGAQYIDAAYRAVKTWLSSIPNDEPIAVAFSGGVDSASVLLLARQALQDLGGDPTRLRAFTLDLGGGRDVEQAGSMAREFGLEDNWEFVKASANDIDLEEAIRVIEDYHPLDVECAAAALCLLAAIRQRYPKFKYLLDGDGGDENLKSYPLEDSDLTLSSVLRNPLLYLEGWGIDAIKHSLTYSGGLSRGYVRTYAPARRFGFKAFSPYTVRSVIAAALAIPIDRIVGDRPERLSALKQEIVGAGIKAVTGIAMPANPKRRFQEGAGGDSYKQWRVSKAWCRRVFLRQWEEKLRVDPSNEPIRPEAMIAAD